MKYIFVDIDGVLNAFSPLDGDDYFETSAAPGGISFRLNLNLAHAKWLTDLAAETGAELVWGTTWQADANEHVGAKIGLPDLPHVSIPPYTRFSRIGLTKAVAVSEWWRKHEGGKSVWFDDEPDCGDYLADTEIGHIEVFDMHGLQPKHIDAARQYLLS